MDRLRSQAAHAGGVVLSHLGNHEWMNAIGTSPDNFLFQLFFYSNVYIGDWR